MSLESRLGIKKDERVILIVRGAFITLLAPLFVSAVFILLPLFFLVPLLSWEMLGMILIGTSVGVGIFFGARTFVKWIDTVAVITDKRLFVVQRDGYLARKVHALPYVKMQGVSYRVKGLWQTIFRYGTVLIRPTAGKPLRIMKVSRPEMLEGFIGEAIEEGEAGEFGDLLHAVSDMESKELQLLKSEIERSLKHRDMR